MTYKIRHAVALLSLISGFAVAATPAPPARMIPIAKGWSGSSINVVANRRHAIFTHDREQFAAFYAADGVMVLAQRHLDDTKWKTTRTRYRGNVADAHNAISIAVDGNGYLHVSWDHHGQPLNYARSEQPLSLVLGPAQSMMGRNETRVTYPEFHLLPDGDLLFLYREGESGNGTLVLNRYATREQRWARIQSELVDGEGQRNAYWGATVDRRGGLHLAWIWRETADVSTNHDIAYAFSPDGGITWKSIEGAARTPPFTAATADYAVGIPANHNLMNSPWVAADMRGRVYITTYWSEKSDDVPQFHVVHHNGRAWATERITSRTQRFTLAGTATRRPPISRGVLLAEGGAQIPGALHLIYRDDSRGGRALMLSTPQVGSGEWTERTLTTDSLGAWEPLIDPVQWNRLQQVHLLTQNVTQADGDDKTQRKTEATTVSVLIIDADAQLKTQAGSRTP